MVVVVGLPHGEEEERRRQQIVWLNRQWKVDADEEGKEAVVVASAAASRTAKDLSPPRTKSVSNCHCRRLQLPPLRAAFASSSSTVLSELVVIQGQHCCCRARRDLKDDVGPDGYLSTAAVGGKQNWRGLAQESEAEGGKAAAAAAVVGVGVVAEQMWMERRGAKGRRLGRLAQRSRLRGRRGRRCPLRNRPGRDRVERGRYLSVISGRKRREASSVVGSRVSSLKGSVSTGVETDRPCISSSIGRG